MNFSCIFFHFTKIHFTFVCPRLLLVKALRAAELITHSQILVFHFDKVKKISWKFKNFGLILQFTDRTLKFVFTHMYYNTTGMYCDGHAYFIPDLTRAHVFPRVYKWVTLNWSWLLLFKWPFTPLASSIISCIMKLAWHSYWPWHSYFIK